MITMAFQICYKDEIMLVILQNNSLQPLTQSYKNKSPILNAEIGKTRTSDAYD